IKLQDRRRKAIEEVVQENGTNWPSALRRDGEIGSQGMPGLKSIQHSQEVAARVIGKNTVSAGIHQHPPGTVGRNEMKTAVVVLALALAHVAECVEEVTRKQTQADPNLQYDNLGLDCARPLRLT